MAKVALRARRPKPKEKPLRRIISRGQLRRRIRELAERIRQDYGQEPPILVVVLKGSFVFAADLVRALGIPLEVDFIQASSYGAGRTSKGEVTVVRDLTADIASRRVLLVEDIVDTGLTLEALRRHLLARRPAELRVCALLAREKALAAGAPIDYLGFAVPEGFVVGYGIDYAEQYRELPEIFVLEGER